MRQITSDDHKGLRNAVTARFGATAWQRCQFHLQQNAMAHVPRRDLRTQVAAEIRHARDRKMAEELLRRMVLHHEKNAPSLSEWLENNIPEGIAALDLPAKQRERLRTTNAAERINKKVKRRTRVTTIFPNEETLLRLASAILVEISGGWETGKTYLLMEGI